MQKSAVCIVRVHIEKMLALYETGPVLDKEVYDKLSLAMKHCDGCITNRKVEILHAKQMEKR